MAKERGDILTDDASAVRSSLREPLLKAKLAVPPLSEKLLSRPGLIEQLNEGFRSRLVLVCAPAGFGKTTLLQQWQQCSSHQARSFARVSLDERDNDPYRFWRYVLAALDSFAPGLEARILPLLSSQQSSLETVVMSLLNTFPAVEQDCLLVLDDYHLIGTPTIHQSLQLLLRYLPPALHLVIGTRVQPPFSLARLRAHGQVVELGAADLRLNLAESRLFLRECLERDLPEHLLSDLHAYTEGWIVGLQLAARVLQRSQEPKNTVKIFTEGYRPLLEYFAEEVFTHQPDALQQFLLATCLLEQLSGSLCEALTQQDHSHDLLETITRANLFLFPLDEQQGWYRYHPLFANFLRASLQQSRPDLIPVLHQRASQWYRQHGMLDEAIAHTCAASKFEEAATLIEQVADTRIKAGEIMTLVHWLKRLSPTIILARPRLCLIYVVTLLMGCQLKAVEPWLQVAEQHLDKLENEEERSMLPAMIASIRAVVSYQDADIPSLRPLARTKESLSHEVIGWQSLVAYLLGIVYSASGTAEATTAAYLEAIDLATRSGNTLIGQMALDDLARFLVRSGSLHQAFDLYQRALYGSSEPLHHLPARGLLAIGLGDILREWNDLSAATSLLLEGIQMCRQMGTMEQVAYGLLSLARVHFALDDAQAAWQTIGEAEQLAHYYGILHVERLVVAQQARFRLAYGDHTAAFRWTHRHTFSPDDDHPYLWATEQLTQVRVLLAQGEQEDALVLLKQVQAGAQTLHSIQIECLLLEASLLQQKGMTTTAVNTLIQALMRAQKEGYIRLFVDEGATVEWLLWKILALHRKGQLSSLSPPLLDYVRQLLAVFKDRAPIAPVSPPQEKQALIEPLSEREREILRWLATGATSQEIAQRLSVAVGTVKAHLHTIYGKLNVRNRTQAIAAARAAHLLTE